MINYHFLPSHTHDNGHTFNWTETQIFDQLAKTKHAREFKEAWYSIDNNTMNRHIDIPPAFLQLKHSYNKNKYCRQPLLIIDSAPVMQDCPTMTTHPTTTNQTLQPTKEYIYNIYMSHYVPIADKKLRHADFMRIGSTETNLCIM